MRRGERIVMVLALASACTRPNPAFGLDDGSTEPGGASTSKSESAGDLDSTTRDEGSASATTMIGSDGPNETTGSTGSELCILPAPALFDVKEVVDDVAVQPCGSRTISGSVFDVSGHRVTIARCSGGSCECAEPELVTLEFSGLDPSPPQILDATRVECVTLLVEWTTADEGEPCRTRSLSIRRSDANTYTVYVAANELGDELTAPPVTFGPPLDECNVPCTDRPVGRYTLKVGEHVLAPGAPASEIELAAQGGGVAVYQVAALAAQVDLACDASVSWLAYLE